MDGSRKEARTVQKMVERRTGDHIRGLDGQAPAGVGCYLFRSSTGETLYVGKAKNLARRLASYRRAEATRTRIMLSQANEVSWILLESEQEALTTERELIRTLRPRWNVKLRDDREYPQIRIREEAVPTILIERSGSSSSQTAGPYRSRRQAQQLLDLLLECRPVRSCDGRTFQKAQRQQRACLLADVGRCSAPCVGAIDQKTHREDMAAITAFLNGDSDPLLQEARQRMLRAAEERRFETAARLRDLSAAAEQAAAAQPLVAQNAADIDVWGTAEDDEQACLTLLRIRNGRIVGNRSWLSEGTAEHMTEQAMRAQYQRGTSAERILSSIDVEERIRREGERRHIRVHQPKRGESRRLVQRAERNASEMLRRDRNLRRVDRREQALQELAELVDRSSIRSIEGYDISHLDGRGTCGSQVRFDSGEQVRAATRVRNMREDRNDDPGSMRELLTRRAASDEPLPDLILVDGGTAQLTAAMAALPPGTPIVALAKEHEELHLPDTETPLRLPRTSAALQLLQQIRDEAHRTALRHQRRRRKESLRSILQEAPGIGPERARLLNRHYRSLEEIAEADAAELRALGIPQKATERLQELLRRHLAAAEARRTIRENGQPPQKRRKEPDGATGRRQ